MAKKNSINNETKVVCPNCGAEFAIPEREHVAIGIAIGKDSGLGVVFPSIASISSATETVSQKTPTNQTPAQMKAEAKIEALRKAGVNVDNLFSMKGAAGQETIARLENGKLTIVPDDDPIFAAIIKRGTVPNRRLFRRWVMAQMFHMLTYKAYYGHGKGFIDALEAKGYKYQWKMVLEEMRVQAKLAKSDPENFVLRNRWFNAERIVVMCDDYVKELINYVGQLRERHCKGVPYVKLSGMNIFKADLATKVYGELNKAIVAIRYAKNPDALYYAVQRFYNLAKHFRMVGNIPMSQAFKDAYKGAGAYFTMKNLILFHGASFKNGCIKLGQKKSLAHLEAKAEEYGATKEGWRLFGVMKKLIADAGINIEQKMAEWRK